MKQNDWGGIIRIRFCVCVPAESKPCPGEPAGQPSTLDPLLGAEGSKQTQKIDVFDIWFIPQALFSQLVSQTVNWAVHYTSRLIYLNQNSLTIN